MLETEKRYRSDLSGEPIAGDPAVIRIQVNGHTRTLHCTPAEANAQYEGVGTVSKTQGRKRK